MAEARRANYSAEVGTGQLVALRNAESPKATAELLTLREAQKRFEVNHRQIYAWVTEGRLHAVQVGGKGRILYPEWELRELVHSLSSAFVDPAHTAHAA